MTTVNAVGNGLSGSTGTGSFVGSTSPTLVTPALGTPSSGTLTSCTGLPLTTGVTGLLPLANGGSNANLTANAGGIVWSNSTQLQILSGTSTANQVLLAGNAATPAWSTATYPATTTINQLLYSSSANTIAGLATGNNGVLITGGGGIPSISSTLPTAVQGNITSLGTIGTGGITTTGNLTAGSAGNPGTVQLFPTTASKGYLYIVPANNAANYQVEITNASFGQASTLTIPDPGVSTANFLVSQASFPVTTTINQILYSSSANTIVGLATANNSVLATNGAGVPALTTSLPTAVQVGVNSLNSGTSASSSTFWRGDGTWASVGGSGTVNSGTTGQIAYYASNGTTVSGESTVPVTAGGTGNTVAFITNDVFAASFYGAA